MPQQISLVLTPKQAADKETYTSIAADHADIEVSQIAMIRVLKRSIDARKRVPKINLTLELYIDNEPTPSLLHFDYPNVDNATPIVIVGSGPAALFAALRLVELNYKPILLERGKDVSSRKIDIADINRNKEINPDSNYAFGEGGAGTFSDGKLFTRSKKRGDYNKILQTLVFHGANPEILFDAHPHIGTDKLPKVISNIRQTLISCGAIFRFNSKVTDIILKGDKVTGVKCGDEVIDGAAVVLATGHSAKDIYIMLHDKGVRVEAKPFAMGVRVEHPQSLIDSIQYNQPERGEWLPAASYSLVNQVGGRGVYSFCMCPGGFIVPAMTNSKECVVNGMSASDRNSVYANAGVVTEVRLSDFEHLRAEHGELAGLYYQQQYEELARSHGGDGQIAPAQRVGDFVAGRRSSTLQKSSYVPGVTSSDMHNWLPSLVSDSLREGISAFNRKMRGFVTNEALIIGVESRTSTPVRIPRDKVTLAHEQYSNLYPAGEGAGYAGGIVSAALDGENIANAINLSKL